METPAQRQITRGMYSYMMFVASGVHVLVAAIVYWGSLQDGAPPLLAGRPWLGPLVIMLVLPMDLGVLTLLRRRAPEGTMRDSVKPQ